MEDSNSSKMTRFGLVAVLAAGMGTAEASKNMASHNVVHNVVHTGPTQSQPSFHLTPTPRQGAERAFYPNVSKIFGPDVMLETASIMPLEYLGNHDGSYVYSVQAHAKTFNAATRAVQMVTKSGMLTMTPDVKVPGSKPSDEKVLRVEVRDKEDRIVGSKRKKKDKIAHPQWGDHGRNPSSAPIDQVDDWEHATTLYTPHLELNGETKIVDIDWIMLK